MVLYYGGFRLVSLEFGCWCVGFVLFSCGLRAFVWFVVCVSGWVFACVFGYLLFYLLVAWVCNVWFGLLDDWLIVVS